MTKNRYILLLIILVVVLTSCEFRDLKVSNTIKQPKLMESPIGGSWVLVEYRDMPGLEKETINSKILGEKALFKDGIIIVGDFFSENVTYSTKNVDAEDYLLYKYKLDPSYLDIHMDRLDIISIYSDEQFTLEIIRLSEEAIIIYKDNQFLFFQKKSDQVDKKEIMVYIDIEKNVSGLYSMRSLNDEALRNGLLIGLKKEVDDGGVKNWEYRTVYFKFDDLSGVSIYELNDILLPRKTGFYDVKMDRKEENGKEFDYIYVESRDERSNLVKYRSGFMKNILYIGNDYISLENLDQTGKRFLRIHPLDYLRESESLLLSEALDRETIDRVKKDIKLNENDKIKKYFDERNFGLARRNGYWTLVGRVNYKLDDEYRFEDFNIRAITPKSLVNYDELNIPWSYIKTKIPDLVDAFTSPNGEVLIVQTYNQIKGYPIRDNKIINEEIFKVDLAGSESIIMNEWATGIYSELWEDEVLKILKTSYLD